MDNVSHPDFTQSRQLRAALRGVREMTPEDGAPFDPQDDVAQAARYFYQREQQVFSAQAPLQLQSFRRRKRIKNWPLMAALYFIGAALVLALM